MNFNIGDEFTHLHETLGLRIITITSVMPGWYETRVRECIGLGRSFAKVFSREDLVQIYNEGD